MNKLGKNKFGSRVLAIFLAFMMAISGLGFGNVAKAASYEKVSGPLTSGKYVMVLDNGIAPTVYENGWVLFEEIGTNPDSWTNVENVTWNIEVNGDKVTLTDKNGVSIAPKAANTNGIVSKDYGWTLIDNGDGTFSFEATKENVTFAGNMTTGQSFTNQFRAYKNSTVSGSPKIYPSKFNLYKLSDGTVDSVDPTDPVDPVADMTVEDIIAMQAKTGQEVTFIGYIVGQAKNGQIISDPKLIDGDYNIAIASTPDETDGAKALNVRLAYGSAPYADFNIRKNPSIIGSKVIVTGPLFSEPIYFPQGYINPATTIKLVDTTDPVVTVDKSALEKTIQDGLAINLSGKTADTAKVLTDAIEAGKAVVADEKATQDEVNKAIKDINDAIAALVDMPVVDDTKLTLTFDTSEWTGEALNPVVLNRNDWGAKWASVAFQKYNGGTVHSLPVVSNTETHYFANWTQKVVNADGSIEYKYVNNATEFTEDTVLYPHYAEKKNATFYILPKDDSNTGIDWKKVNYSIFNEAGEKVNSHVLGYTFTPIEEGKYTIKVDSKDLAAAGIKITSVNYYTRDNIHEIMNPTASENGDMSLVSLDADGNLTINYEMVKTARNLSGDEATGYHNAFIWLNVNTEAVEVAPVVETNTTTEKVVIPFETITNQNDQLYIGQENVIKEGVDGLKEVTTSITTIDGVAQDPVITEAIIKEAVDRIVEVGTKALPENETKVTAVAFETETKYDPNLPLGETIIEREGVDGQRTVVYEYVIENNQLVKKIVSDQITKEPITKVVIEGTKEASMYTVTYTFNKDDTGVTLPEAITVVEGTEIELAKVSPEVTDKYSFLGWDTNGDGKIDAQAGDKVTVTSDMTVNAIWEGNYGKIGFVFHTEEYLDFANYTWNHHPIADLSGYDVILKDGQGNIIERAATTATGEVFFNNLPKGDYTFELVIPQDARLVKVVDGNFSRVDSILPFVGNTITLPFINYNLTMERTIFVQVSIPVTTTNTEDVIIPFETEIKYNPDKYVGQEETLQEGVDGLKKVTTSVTTIDGVAQEPVVTEVIVTEPVNKIIEKGSKPIPSNEKIEIAIGFETIIEEDPNLPAGEISVVQEGQSGLRVITKGYKLVGNELVEYIVSDELVKEATAKIVKVGTKLPEVIEKETRVVVKEEAIKFGRQTISDDNLYLGQEILVQEGKDGKKVITYTETLENGIVVSTTEAAEEILEEAISEVVRVGTKALPENRLSEVELGYKVIVKEDPTLEAGQTRIEQEGKSGIRQITIGYKIVNNELVEYIVEDKVTVEAIDEIMIVGTKAPVVPEKETKVTVTKEIIPFETKVVESTDLYVGQEKVTREGQNGLKVTTVTETYEDGKLIDTQVVTEEVIQAVSKLVTKGTKALPENKTATETVAYKTIEIEDSNLEKGQTEVIQEGKEGIRTIVKGYKIVNNELVEYIIFDEITTDAVNKIVAIGTKEEKTPGCPIDLDESKLPRMEVPTRQVQSVSDIWIRKEPKNNGEKVGILKAFTTIEVYNEFGSWTRTNYGWVATDYLYELVKPETNMWLRDAANGRQIGILSEDEILLAKPTSWGWSHIYGKGYAATHLLGYHGLMSFEVGSQEDVFLGAAEFLGDSGLNVEVGQTIEYRAVNGYWIYIPAKAGYVHFTALKYANCK